MSLFAPEGSAAPLAVRMRPRTLEEVVGQEHLLGPTGPLRGLLAGSGSESGRISVVLWGPPGTGKTTLALLMSEATDRDFVQLSAVTAGVKDVRSAIEGARRNRELSGRGTVLFLDEVHRFTKAQQDALLPAVENGWITLVAATTENPSFSVIAPLLSRSLVLPLQPLRPDQIGTCLDRACSQERGLGGAYALQPAARDALVRLAAGDARRALTMLGAAAGQAGESGEISADDVAAAVQHAAVRYDRAGDQHYDVASALIKSVRGSDVDAALHYLARMVAAGEDPRFIARRLVILASEDIGMADHTALQTAVAALHAVAQIGLPEARLTLAQAVVHLSLAPKSNAVYTGYERAAADVRDGRGGSVPPHLRDAHYPGAADHGHGTGYRYAHDEPTGVAAQDYLPDDLVGASYYRPTDHGAEARWREVWTRLRGLLGRSDESPGRPG
jgi:putative ATPase